MTNPPLPPESTGRLRALSGIVRDERRVLVVFIASRLFVWLAAWLGTVFLPPGPFAAPSGSSMWELLFHWDAGWYASIVQHGYVFQPGVESNVAFFPLLPALAWLVASCGLPIPLAGWLVANSALLASALLLRRYAAATFPDARVPERAVVLLLCCPVSFFHSAFYTESLFLALSLASLDSARRGRWLLAGVAAALLGLTRANGFLIGPALAWEAWNQSRAAGVEFSWRRPLGALLLAPFGFLAWMIVLHLAIGDALAFAHAQAAWNRHLHWPWVSILRAGKIYPAEYACYFLAAAATSLCIWTLSWCRGVRASAQILAGLMLGLALSSTLLESFPRYASAAFPLYLGLAALTAGLEKGFGLLVLASLAFLAGGSALFAAGYWMT